MKVISGFLKGRKIDGFNLEGTRPTMDRVKESLFAMIQNYIPDSTCLDLFAGSGSLAIEAISMGAKCAYLIDNNKKAISIVNKNINNFNISEKCNVINMDYLVFLNSFSDEKFDIIFLDPPYKTDYINKALYVIYNNSILNNDGIIVCETDNLKKIDYMDRFDVIKQKKYGDKLIVILKKI